MSTLREYMHANPWVAVTAGLTVDDALHAFERAGAPVDAAETIQSWTRASFSADDLHRVVRAKLIDAKAGRKVYVRMLPKVYPGASDHVSPTLLPSGRSDDEALAMRIVGRFCGDHRSTAEIAEIEGIPEQRVMSTLWQHGVDTKARKRPSARSVSVQEEAAAAAEKRRQDAVERIRACYAKVGRRAPADLEQRVGMR